jgi:ABC-type branched-subunit amino acid transport system substrate-binding protein
VTVVARWLAVLAASLLLGGALTGSPERFRRAAPQLALFAAVAASETVIAAGSTVTATEAGVASLVRLGVLVLFGLAQRWGVAGALALVATAFDGHVVSASWPAAVAQVAHVLAAGVWMGGVLALALFARTREAARRFVPVAVAALAVAVVTGVVAALREVDGWYFLRWSDYGRAVIVKAGLVVVAAAVGAVARWRRAEAVIVVLVAGVASLLAALPQGRGQALPAERGTLLAGPAFASVVGAGGSTAGLTLAPARTGANRIVLTARGRSGSVRLACSCSPAPVTATLRPTAGGTLAAGVRVPRDGTWYAYVTVDGRRSPAPAALPVGVPEAPGAPPVDVLAVADLSGPDATRCRDFLLGLQLAVGRQNALGGLDGGRKVALLAYDSAGSAARASALAGGRGPIALAGACGAGAGAAVTRASRDGVPSVIGDPGVPAAAGTADAFRVAGDPAAEGYAAARYVREIVRPTAPTTARTVRLVTAGDASARRWVAGWTAGLAGSGIEVQTQSVARFERTRDLERLVDRRRAIAVGLDGPPSLARTLARIHGPANAGYAPAAVLASARTFDEDFVERSGVLGRLGVVRGASEVTPDARDALAYAHALPGLFPGERPSLQGIRGYVTGLALSGAVRRGTQPAEIARALRRPRPFTDALAAPWRADAPSLGGQRFTMLGTTFQSATLIPPSAGGEAYSGTFFPDGAWNRLSSELYGPPLTRPPLASG